MGGFAEGADLLSAVKLCLRPVKPARITLLGAGLESCDRGEGACSFADICLSSLLGRPSRAKPRSGRRSPPLDGLPRPRHAASRRSHHHESSHTKPGRAGNIKTGSPGPASGLPSQRRQSDPLNLRPQRRQYPVGNFSLPFSIRS